jgi:hypothetical protein
MALGISSLLHEVSPPFLSAGLLRDLPEVKLCVPSSGSDDYRFFAQDLMAVVLPPELENLFLPLGIFSEVSKASTFASPVSSIPLDLAYVLGMLSLLSFVLSEIYSCAHFAFEDLE